MNRIALNLCALFGYMFFASSLFAQTVVLNGDIFPTFNAKEYRIQGVPVIDEYKKFYGDGENITNLQWGNISGVPALPTGLNDRVITVGLRDCEFTSIQAAIDSVKDASETSPVCVLVYPGTYAEKIVLKDYVSLCGFGKSSKIISSVAGNGNDPTTWMIAASNGTVENLYIENRYDAYSSTAIGFTGCGTLRKCYIVSAGQDTVIYSLNADGLIEDCEIVCTAMSGGVADTLAIYNSSMIIKNTIIKAINQGSPLWLGNTIIDSAPKFFDCTFIESNYHGVRLFDSGSAYITPYFFNCRFLKSDMTPSIMIRNESHGTKTTVYHHGCIYLAKGEDACSYVEISSGDNKALSYTTTGSVVAGGAVSGGSFSGGYLSVSAHTDNALSIANDASNFMFGIDYSNLSLNWSNDMGNYDTKLYRGDANSLKTDGSFNAVSGFKCGDEAGVANESFNIVTDMQIKKDENGDIVLDKKTRSVTINGGIITNVGEESNWTRSGKVKLTK